MTPRLTHGTQVVKGATDPAAGTAHHVGPNHANGAVSDALAVAGAGFEQTSATAYCFVESHPSAEAKPERGSVRKLELAGLGPATSWVRSASRGESARGSGGHGRTVTQFRFRTSHTIGLCWAA